MAGCSLRMGEVTAIRVEPYSDAHSTISPDCRTIYIRKSVRRGVEQDPKTVNAVRDIDVAPELTNAVKRYIAGQDFKKSNQLTCFRHHAECRYRSGMFCDSLHLV